MKKIAVLFFAIFSLTTIVFAQGDKKAKLTVEERVTKQITHIQSVTGCNTDQVDKIKSAATTKFTKIDEVHAKYKGQKDKKEAMKSEVQPIRKAFREELRKVLTVDQMKKLRESKKSTGTEDSEDYQK